MKHTNFTEEIQGYRTCNFLLTVVMILIPIALAFSITDFIWGAETVTNVLADLVIKVKNY